MPAATNARNAGETDQYIAGILPAGCQLDRRANGIEGKPSALARKKFGMIARPNDPLGVRRHFGGTDLGLEGGFKDPARKLLSLASLEADLDAVVDFIEAEWQLHGTVRRESAEQVHTLLQRALAL